ncbi:MAG TPA: TraR/DksA C4-type zinc finger protein [Burkholderiaceae bacterium]|nr:TraR/DksA C4-type zinc finger protein [Burkholderiaceae bacterium]
MQTYDSSLAGYFRQKLAQREAELGAVLRASDDLAGTAAEDGSGEVVDFKDMAEKQSQAVLNEAKAENAAHEFEQVLTARRRLENHGYGLCQRCGEPIDLRRLKAMPEAACCTACQAAHEQGAGS